MSWRASKGWEITDSAIGMASQDGWPLPPFPETRRGKRRPMPGRATAAPAQGWRLAACMEAARDLAPDRDARQRAVDEDENGRGGHRGSWRSLRPHVLHLGEARLNPCPRQDISCDIGTNGRGAPCHLPGRGRAGRHRRGGEANRPGPLRPVAADCRAGGRAWSSADPAHHPPPRVDRGGRGLPSPHRADPRRARCGAGGGAGAGGAAARAAAGHRLQRLRPDGPGAATGAFPKQLSRGNA